MVKTISVPDFALEITAGADIGRVVAGVDEAGRGSWAGPVVAAAVILNPKNLPDGVDDSKKLTAKKREVLYAEILQNSATGIGIGSVEEIDRLNILEATKLAMQRAVMMLGKTSIDLILVDGNQAPNLAFPTKTIIGGDAKSLSIAAASIIAKVTRDRLMCELAELHPHYGWERNAGYGTKQHQIALARYFITEHHRCSYKPIMNIMVKHELQTPLAVS